MYRRNLGEQIKDIVEDAVGSSNYQDLNNKIRYTADRAIDEFNKATNSFCNGGKSNQKFGFDGKEFRFDDRDNRKEPNNKGNQTQQGTARSGYSTNGQPNRGQARREQREYRHMNKKAYKHMNKKAYRQGTSPYPQRQYSYYNKYEIRKSREKRPKGSISSIVYLSCGYLGVTGFGIAAIVLGCIWASTGFFQSVFQILTCVFLIVTLLFAGMIGVGLGQRKRIKRYRIYKSLLEKNKFCEIKRMAEYLNKSKKYVISDLRKMMLLSMFPEGHFDDNMTCFIEDEETYKQYVEAQKNYQERLSEEEKHKAYKSQEEKKYESEELAKAIADGNAYIKEIREANDDIPGEEISRKLDRLENIISKIFVCVEKHPEKLGEIRKFMEYYLPITMKLVNAYKEFDGQPIQGENITNSKKEIENTLDTIDQAFEKLLDSLYEDEAMEVSSDISVLNTLFAQEGLTKKDFDLK